MTKQVLIATQNQGKIKEILAILQGFDLDFVTPKDIGLSINPKETGDSYAANARLKAKAYCEASGLVTLSDDSGLEVDALFGTPGIFSARFSPKENATDRDRRIYLLEKLQSCPQPWTAHFHCTAVMAIPGDIFIETNGSVQGIIIPEERGTGGFGYDPIFYVPEFDKTMAELEPSVKNTISHRARALSAMAPFIKVIEKLQII
jgi:XTP/dITP diphosphohydrolase